MAKQKTQNPTLIQTDFPLWSILNVAKDAVHTVIAYVQAYTEYGEAYEEAYQALMKINDELSDLKPTLEKCVQNRKEGK